MKKELLAPNGKPSNLTSEQYKLVRTDAFKNWFGNWENDPENASKAVDDNGEPLVVYHSSKNEFNIFEKEKISQNFDYSFGFYFSNDIEDSKEYGKITKSFFLNIKNPYIFYVDDNSNGSVFIDVNRYEAINEIVKSRKTGIEIDGVIAYSYANGYVAMYSNQIKLADGGNSTFDSNNPDIRFEKGGLIAPNGKPSNLTPEQYKLVRTDAFKNWFGNWESDPESASKVIDDNGEPMVCYHGTFSDSLNFFDESKISRNTGNEGHYGYGFYFSFSKIEASTYTYDTNPIILECFLNIRNPFLSSNINHLERYAKDYGYYEEKKPVAIDSNWLELQLKKYKDQKPYLLYKSIKENGYEKGWKLFLNKNKVDWDNETFDYNKINDWFEYDSSLEQFSKENEKENYNYEIPEHILEDLSEQLNVPISEIKTLKQYTLGNYPTLLYMMDLGNRSRILTDDIKKDGFDGIIAGTEIVLFKPNQIKLADGTNTTFDSSNDDIRFEQGGETKYTTPDYLVMFLGR